VGVLGDRGADLALRCGGTRRPGAASASCRGPGASGRGRRRPGRIYGARVRVRGGGSVEEGEAEDLLEALRACDGGCTRPRTGSSCATPCTRGEGDTRQVRHTRQAPQRQLVRYPGISPCPGSAPKLKSHMPPLPPRPSAPPPAPVCQPIAGVPRLCKPQCWGPHWL